MIVDPSREARSTSIFLQGCFAWSTHSLSHHQVGLLHVLLNLAISFVGQEFPHVKFSFQLTYLGSCNCWNLLCEKFMCWAFLMTMSIAIHQILEIPCLIGRTLSPLNDTLNFLNSPNFNI
eukprot:TRINITY_DN7816_c0_g1_i4.p1 TRINITY_DN7816_c0_g1~~TRINITY_DN7816_c0_g1_i4.p1  ORF type:complete len:120 (-),score=8.57 TRINITY_DN7816_c0_g1_i4:174-533(-)